MGRTAPKDTAWGMDLIGLRAKVRTVNYPLSCRGVPETPLETFTCGEDLLARPSVISRGLVCEGRHEIEGSQVLLFKELNNNKGRRLPRHSARALVITFIPKASQEG